MQVMLTAYVRTKRQALDACYTVADAAIIRCRAGLAHLGQQHRQ